MKTAIVIILYLNKGVVQDRNPAHAGFLFFGGDFLFFGGDKDRGDKDSRKYKGGSVTKMVVLGGNREYPK